MDLPDKPYTAYNRYDCQAHSLALLNQVRELRAKFAELEEESPFTAMNQASATREAIMTTMAEAQVWATLATVDR